MKTPNLALTMLQHSQAKKELAINEAIIALEILQNNQIIALQADTPSVEINDGDLYIISDKPTFTEWQDQANKLAYYLSGWRFLQPKAGLLLWSKEQKLLVFDGNNWQILYPNKG